MKFSRKIYILVVTIFVFLFGINNVKAKNITCEYEMYPVGYDVKNGMAAAKLNSKYDTPALIKYDGTEYFTRVSTLQEKLTNETKKKDKSFKKEVDELGKCPPYVKAKKGSLKSIDLTEFTKEVNSFYPSEYNYPMFLVKENGNSVAEPATAAFNVILGNWKQIISQDNNLLTQAGCSTSIVDAATYGMDEESFYEYVASGYNNRNEKDKNLTEACDAARRTYVEDVKAARNLQKVVENSGSGTAKSAIKKSTSWSTFYDYVMKSTGKSDKLDEQNKLQSQVNSATSDFCYFYCDSTACAGIPEGAGKDACKSSCNSTSVPKCQEAYDACKGVQSSVDQSSCLQNKLSEKGLDSSYVTTRAQEMASLQQELEKVKKEIQVATAAKINVSFEPYKLTCDDVKIFHQLWVIFLIVAPALTILMGTLDMGKAVISGNEEKIQKAWKKFPKRLLALVALLVIPWMISLILGITTDENARDTSLMYCIIHGGE